MNDTKEYPQLGFGVMRLPYIDEKVDMVKAKAIIDEYMQGEFCYFDMHPKYMNGLSEQIVKSFVVEKYSRESFLLADKMPIYVQTSSDYERYFNSSLMACGVSYFDYYLLHALTREVYEKHKCLGGFEFLKDLKAEGKVRNIGFSFHDKPDLLDEILSEHPEIDFVQLQINYLDWESPVICAKECYEVARKYGKLIFVMEPIKGGSLANKTDSMKDKETIEDINLPEIALRFVASLPGIVVILSGMAETEHVIQNRRTLSNKVTLNEAELQLICILRKLIMQENIIPCTSCKYCMEDCPQNIPIPHILSLVNACGNTGKHDRTYVGRFKIFYNGYVFNKGTAGSCIKCGKCEKRCPQKIEIRKHLSVASSMFDENIETVKKQRQRWKHECRILQNWIEVLHSGKTLEHYFEKKGFRTIAIYGMGDMGELLLQEIQQYNSVSVKYGIDKRGKLLSKAIPVKGMDDVLEDVDAVIVTLVYDFDNIEKQLGDRVNCPIISIEQVVDRCLLEGEM